MYSSTGRLRAIQLPCFCSISHRGAAAAVSLVGTAMYAAWACVLWKTSAKLLGLSTSTSYTSNHAAVTSMRSLVNVALYLAGTIGAVFLGVLVSCVFPQQDVLKHLSRLLWVGWCGTWILGVIGVVTFVSGDLPFTEECTALSWSTNCASWWGEIQAWTVAGVFITLLLHFYFSVVVSSYTHTLHPHLFFQDDESEDDDLYDDSDDEHRPPTLAAGRPLDINGLRRRSGSRGYRRSEKLDFPPSYHIKDVYGDEMYGSSESGSEEDEEAGREAEVRMLRAKERKEAQIRQEMYERRLEEEGEDYPGDDGPEKFSSDGEDVSALRGRERVGRLADRERKTLL